MTSFSLGQITAFVPSTTNVGRWMLGIASCVLLCGCTSTEGPERVPVTGIVKLDGRELAAGVIRFIPTGSTQGPATSATIQNGHYEFTCIDGPILGKHRVEIEATEYLGFALDDEVAFAQTVRQSRTGLAKNPVPENYNRQSSLNVDVTAEGSHEFNYELFTNGSAVSPH